MKKFLAEVKIQRIVVLVLALFLVASCAALKPKWNNLTPDEKARIILDGMQEQLNGLWNTANAYVAANPQYQDMWKVNGIPAFDAANKAIRSTVEIAMTEKITPNIVYDKVQPAINSVIGFLVSVGALNP
jgi:hypothetical protein